MSDMKESKPGADEIGSRIRTMLRLHRPQDVAAFVMRLPDESAPWRKWYVSLTVMACAAKTPKDAVCWKYILDEFTPEMPARCATDLVAAQRAMLQRISTAERLQKVGVAALAERQPEPVTPRARAVLDDRLSIMAQMGCRLIFSPACEAVLLQSDSDGHLANLRSYLSQAFKDNFERDGCVRPGSTIITLTFLRHTARKVGLEPPWT